MSVFDDACEYARECGIPDEFIEDVAAEADLCCEGPYGDGVCAENTRSIIKGAAEKYVPVTVDKSTKPYAQPAMPTLKEAATLVIVCIGLFSLCIVSLMAGVSR